MLFSGRKCNQTLRGMQPMLWGVRSSLQVAQQLHRAEELSAILYIGERYLGESCLVPGKRFICCNCAFSKWRVIRAKLSYPRIILSILPRRHLLYLQTFNPHCMHYTLRPILFDDTPICISYLALALRLDYIRSHSFQKIKKRVTV
jgi:hypothetical protein